MCAYKYYISASTGIANLNSNSSDFSSVHAFCIEQNVSSEEVQPKKKKNIEKRVQNNNTAGATTRAQKVAQRKTRACCVSKASETEKRKKEKPEELTYIHSSCIRLYEPAISHNLFTLAHRSFDCKLPDCQYALPSSVAHTATHPECVYSMPTIVNNHVRP